MQLSDKQILAELYDNENPECFMIIAQQLSHNDLNNSDSNSGSEALRDPIQASSLVDAIKNASATTEGKTMSYFYSLSSGATGVAVPVTSVGAPEPVVGWLVCIKGVHIGESFSIFSGMNSIGRNLDNRIALGKDQSISREKHAVLTFEPKQQHFYIKPGDSSGLTYVNDSFITDTVLLNDRAIIEIGSTRLMLIPLCGNGFSWHEYIK